MRHPPPPRRALRFFFAIAALTAAAVLGAAVGCGPPDVFWTCQNPKTGKEDPTIGDFGHLGPIGQSDPCHCYDACGPSVECPIVVDAGSLGPGCADGGDAGH